MTKTPNPKLIAAVAKALKAGDVETAVKLALAEAGKPSNRVANHD